MHAMSIVVEGQLDADLLRKLLPKRDLGEFRFFAAKGRISLATVARNIVVHEGIPTFVVMDADTLSGDAAEESRRATKAVIEHVAGGLPVEVFSFLPQIEVVFFEAPRFLAASLGRDLAPEETQRGLAAPKATILALMQQAGLDPSIGRLLAGLDEIAAEEVGRGSQCAALTDVLQRFLAKTRQLPDFAQGPA